MDKSEVKFLEFAGVQAVGNSVEMTLLAPPQPSTDLHSDESRVGEVSGEQLVAAAIQAETLDFDLTPQRFVELDLRRLVKFAPNYLGQEFPASQRRALFTQPDRRSTLYADAGSGSCVRRHRSLPMEHYRGSTNGGTPPESRRRFLLLKANAHTEQLPWCKNSNSMIM
jgi:hypothetical protein